MRTRVLALGLVFAALPTMAVRVWYEDFTDGVLGDDGTPGGAVFSTLGSPVALHTANAGRGFASYYGSQGHTDTKWLIDNLPAQPVSLSTGKGVYFYRYTQFSDYSYLSTTFENVNGPEFTRADGGTDPAWWKQRSFAYQRINPGPGYDVGVYQYGSGVFSAGGVNTPGDTGFNTPAMLMNGATSTFLWRGDLATGKLEGEVSGGYTTPGGAFVAGTTVLQHDEYNTLAFIGDQSPISWTLEKGASVDDGAVFSTVVRAMYDADHPLDTDPGRYNMTNLAPYLQFGYSRAELGVTVTGDFNLDYVVDALDYQIWFKNAYITPITSGASFIDGDADNDGNVDWADAQFAGIPEPASLALLSAGLFLLRRRRGA